MHIKKKHNDQNLLLPALFSKRKSRDKQCATNMKRFYDESPIKIQNVLNSLTEEELQIGLSFEQQVKGESSIPDALISQPPLRIFFETKRGESLERNQIERHLESIEASRYRGGKDILIGLTKEPIAQTELEELSESARQKSVIFAAMTFSQLAELLAGECADYEHDLSEIVNDFKQYLADERLLEERRQLLPVLLCSKSHAENVQFGLYYEPSHRPCKSNHKIIGIYARKRISHIGEVRAIVVTRSDGERSFDVEFGVLTEKFKNRIERCMDTSVYSLAEDPHRIYLVDEFHETDIQKTSPGGPRGLRYLDMRDLVEDFEVYVDAEAAEIADALRSSTFE